MIRCNWIVAAAALAAINAFAADGAAASLPVKAVKTHFPRREVLVAAAELQPGTGDRTADIQRAVDAVHAGGGGTVFMKAGRYRVDGAVEVRRGVVLAGDYSASQPARSTVVEVYGGRGEEDGAAAFQLEAGSGLDGLVFHYPEQSVAKPTPYPWTVRSAGKGRAGNNQTVLNCTFVNSWQAVNIDSQPNELHTLRDVRICALKTGFSTDMVTDIGRLTRLVVSPSVWEGSGFAGAPARGTLAAKLKALGAVGILMGRSDWEYMREILIEGCAAGVRFQKEGSVPMNGVMAASTIRGCTVALDVVNLNEVGLSCYDCRFSGEEQTLRCADAFNSIVQFHSCRIEGGPLSLNERGKISLRRCKIAAEIRSRGGEVLRETGEDAFPPASEIIRMAPVKWPRPASDEVLNVADFGASPALEDNSDAFNAALKAAAPRRCTVYAPAGLYRFRKPISVPAGVELRGSADVPHHTMSAGSVLLVEFGEGSEGGEPFCTLQPGAGLKGISTWYPRQPVSEPVPYPWTVRAKGRGCYLVNVNMGNSWLGADFASTPCPAHYVSYFSGCCYKRGIEVAGASSGRIEDIQFNPHYCQRLSPGLPVTWGEGEKKQRDAISHFLRGNLRGIVIRDCAAEEVAGTFLFASYEGISFDGSTRARVLIHGSDTTCRCSASHLSATGRVRMALGQFVPLGHPKVEGAACLAADDRGDSRFYASQIWPDKPAMLNRGNGYGLMDQFNSFTTGVVSESGRTESYLGNVLRR